MEVTQEVLSKRYVACGLKRMFPWYVEIDRTESRLIVLLGFKTAVTLRGWTSFVCMAVFPTCVQGTVWLIAV